MPVTDLEGFHRMGQEAARAASSSPRPASARSATWPANCSPRTAGLKMTHVPYKGQAPTTNAVRGRRGEAADHHARPAR